jgi:DNA-binding CsgD family transcriptional regulator
MSPAGDAHLTRKEWYAALLHAHGALPEETAASLGIRISAVEQLLETARSKLDARSGSEIRRVIPT